MHFLNPQIPPMDVDIMGFVPSLWRAPDRTLPPRSFRHGTAFPRAEPPPLMQTQIKRSSLNGTQMWNVSAELHLRQRPLRGFLFPESHNARKTVSITPLRHEPAKRSGSGLGGKHTHVFSVYLSSSAPIRAQWEE